MGSSPPRCSENPQCSQHVCFSRREAVCEPQSFSLIVLYYQVI